MYSSIKSQIHTNFLALAGYPLLWYIKDIILEFFDTPLTKLETTPITNILFTIGTSYFSYMFLTLISALLLFAIRLAYIKLRKQNIKTKNSSFLYNILFNIGFSLYLFSFIIFILYICFLSINTLMLSITLYTQ